MKSQTYSYYPGCTLHSSAKEYDVSARLVCEKLGIKLQELEQWICCGASSAHNTSHLLSIALPAHELLSAEQLGLPLTVACAMCFSRLKYAAHELRDKEKLAQMSQLLGQEFRNTTEVVHLLQVLSAPTDKMALSRPLKGLKVACYYGCMLVRPRDIVNFDDDENPHIMDRLIENLGARAIEWDFKVSCCGASLPLARHDVVLKLSHQIMSQAKKMGADCISVACPMCHSNLDAYQKEIEEEYKDKLELPILYFTQLIGLALGFSPEQLYLNKHFTDPLPMLKSKGLA